MNFGAICVSAARVVRAAIVVALVALVAACGNQVELMSAVPENEANEVVGVLLQAGVQVRKVAGKEGLVALRVSGDQVKRALQVLRDNGLPRDQYMGMGQLFKKEGLISSPLEERARYIYALTQELSSTLSRIDGVLHARVHVVLPERSTSGEPATPSTAAVFLKYKEGYDLERIQPQVRRLVSNSIPGLTPEKVSIVLVASQAPALPPPQPADRAPSTAGRDIAMSLNAFEAGTSSYAQMLLWAALAFALVACVALIYVVWRYVIPQHRASLRTGKAAVSDGASSSA